MQQPGEFGTDLLHLSATCLELVEHDVAIVQMESVSQVPINGVHVLSPLVEVKKNHGGWDEPSCILDGSVLVLILPRVVRFWFWFSIFSPRVVLVANHGSNQLHFSTQG